MEQKKLVTTLVLGFTLVLSLSAVFTAFQIFKIGKKPAPKPTPPPLPAKPSASPAAPEIFQAEPGVCELSFNIQATSTPTPTSTPTSTPTATPTPTSTPSPTPTSTPTPTPTPSPTPTPFFQCTDLGPNPGQPNPGDVLNFTCRAAASNISIDHYNFRVLNNGNDEVPLVPGPSQQFTNATEASFGFTVPTTGAPFTVQCQVCTTSSDTSGCTAWGQQN